MMRLCDDGRCVCDGRWWVVGSGGCVMLLLDGAPRRGAAQQQTNDQRINWTKDLEARTSTSSIMSAEEVAKAFVQHFYQAFDTDVNSVAGLYVSLA